MKKLLIIGGSIVIILLIIININNLYIIVKKPLEYPFPPSKALKNDNVIIYKTNKPENLLRLDQFIENVLFGIPDEITVVTYDAHINWFSKYFITTPKKRDYLKFDGKAITYRKGLSDVIFEEGTFAGIFKEETSEDLIYNLVDQQENRVFLTIMKEIK